MDFFSREEENMKEEEGGVKEQARKGGVGGGGKEILNSTSYLHVLGNGRKRETGFVGV